MNNLREKAEMLKKYLKDVGSHLVICGNIGPTIATFKFFAPPLHFFEPRGSKRTIILFMDTIKLHVEGAVNNIRV